MDPAIVGFGLGVVGALVGMTGIGGGSLMTPLLILVLGSVPGVRVGSNLTLRVPAGVLRTTLGLVLIGAGLALLTKAGLGIPGVVIAAFPDAVAAMVITVLVSDRRNGRRASSRSEAAVPAARAPRLTSRIQTNQAMTGPAGRPPPRQHRAPARYSTIAAVSKWNICARANLPPRTS